MSFEATANVKQKADRGVGKTEKKQPKKIKKAQRSCAGMLIDPRSVAESVRTSSEHVYLFEGEKKHQHKYTPHMDAQERQEHDRIKDFLERYTNLHPYFICFKKEKLLRLLD